MKGIVKIRKRHSDICLSLYSSLHGKNKTLPMQCGCSAKPECCSMLSRMQGMLLLAAARECTQNQPENQHKRSEHGRTEANAASQSKRTTQPYEMASGA